MDADTELLMENREFTPDHLSASYVLPLVLNLWPSATSVDQFLPALGQTCSASVRHHQLFYYS